MRYVISKGNFWATIEVIREIVDRWDIKVISSSHYHSKTEGSISYNALVSRGYKIELDKEQKVLQILRQYEDFKRHSNSDRSS